MNSGIKSIERESERGKRFSIEKHEQLKIRANGTLFRSELWNTNQLPLCMFNFWLSSKGQRNIENWQRRKMDSNISQWNISRETKTLKGHAIEIKTRFFFSFFFLFSLLWNWNGDWIWRNTHKALDLCGFRLWLWGLRSKCPEHEVDSECELKSDND